MCVPQGYNVQSVGIAFRVNKYSMKVSHIGLNDHGVPHSPSLSPPHVRHTQDKYKPSVPAALPPTSMSAIYFITGISMLYSHILSAWGSRNLSISVKQNQYVDTIFYNNNNFYFHKCMDAVNVIQVSDNKADDHTL